MSDILKEKQKENHEKSNLSNDFLSQKTENKTEKVDDADKNEHHKHKDAKINEMEKTISDLKDKVLHLHADMENLRKRHSKEIETTAQFASSSLLKDLVEPFEQLFMAIASISQNVDEKSKNIIDGIEITKKAFEKSFAKHGLVRIFPKGEKFNHDFHQAISQIKQENVEAGIVIDVVQAGYVLNGRIMKPAMVVVSV